MECTLTMAKLQHHTPKPIFKIASPEVYSCNILRYDTRLSKIYVRVFNVRNADPSFYLLFTDVGYFEGPLNWQGAGLYKAPAKSCLSLMVEVGMVKDFMLDDPDTLAALEETANLYQFKTKFRPVQLIAGNVVMRDKAPPELN